MTPQVNPKVRAFLSSHKPIGTYLEMQARKKRLIGQNILVRYYNTPERKFYGKTFHAQISNVDYTYKLGETIRPFQVTSDSLAYPVWVAPYEIRGII